MCKKNPLKPAAETAKGKGKRKRTDGLATGESGSQLLTSH